MYLLTWKRPNVVVWGAILWISLMVSSIALAFGDPWWWLGVPIFVGSAWAQARLYRKFTTRRIPICSQCGVRTDPRFRVCSACGRVKAPSVSP